MTHFAKIQNNTVTEVIVAEQDVIDSGLFGDAASWIQTSYNTRGGVHYGADGNPDDGQALRGNYAGIGYVYDPALDAFYAPQPFASWTLNTTTYTWQAPVPYPLEQDGPFAWNEAAQSWDPVTQPA